MRICFGSHSPRRDAVVNNTVDHGNHDRTKIGRYVGCHNYRALLAEDFAQKSCSLRQREIAVERNSVYVEGIEQMRDLACLGNGLSEDCRRLASCLRLVAEVDEAGVLESLSNEEVVVIYMYHDRNDGSIGCLRAGILPCLLSEFHGHVLDYFDALVASFRLCRDFGAKGDTEVEVMYYEAWRSRPFMDGEKIQKCCGRPTRLSGLVDSLGLVRGRGKLELFYVYFFLKSDI